jgi:hypothetical protein
MKINRLFLLISCFVSGTLRCATSTLPPSGSGMVYPAVVSTSAIRPEFQIKKQVYSIGSNTQTTMYTILGLYEHPAVIRQNIIKNRDPLTQKERPVLITYRGTIIKDSMTVPLSNEKAQSLFLHVQKYYDPTHKSAPTTESKEESKR